MQYINGHKIKHYSNGYDCWVVDDEYAYYSLETLARVLGLDLCELEEILYEF